MDDDQRHHCFQLLKQTAESESLQSEFTHSASQHALEPLLEHVKNWLTSRDQGMQQAALTDADTPLLVAYLWQFHRHLVVDEFVDENNRTAVLKKCFFLARQRARGKMEKTHKSKNDGMNCWKDSES